jgi:hypothetical protein
VVLVLVWGCARSHSIEPSLDRAEALLVILEGIEDEADAMSAGPAVRDWLAGGSQHDLDTRWVEGVSGRAYVALVEPHAGRSAGLRRRLELQRERMSKDPWMREFAPALGSACGLLP